MVPTRRAQPYRAPYAETGPVLDAMLRGRPMFGPHPSQQLRELQKRQGLAGLMSAYAASLRR
jgi:hypothetical protein